MAKNDEPVNLVIKVQHLRKQTYIVILDNILYVR